MDLIGRAEGTDKRDAAGNIIPGSGYNTTYGHGRYNPGGDRNMDLTSKSIAEVRALQRGMLNNQKGNTLRSSAVGRYQMMGYTLDDALKQGIIKPDDKFDAATQDKLALWKMQQRGLGDVDRGRMSKDQYANNLAREWASLPKSGGGSNYAGQRASVGRGDVLAALEGGPNAAPQQQAMLGQTINAPVVPPPTPQGGARENPNPETPPGQPDDPRATRAQGGAREGQANGIGESRMFVAPGANLRGAADQESPTAPVALTSKEYATPPPMGGGGTQIGSISMPVSVTVNAGGGADGKTTDPNEIARVARLEVARETQRQMAALRQRLHD